MQGLLRMRRLGYLSIFSMAIVQASLVSSVASGELATPQTSSKSPSEQSSTPAAVLPSRAPQTLRNPHIPATDTHCSSRRDKEQTRRQQPARDD